MIKLLQRGVKKTWRNTQAHRHTDHRVYIHTQNIVCVLHKIYTKFCVKIVCVLARVFVCVFVCLCMCVCMCVCV